MKITWVGFAFRGIQVAVAFLILNAGLKMFGKLKKSVFNVLLLVITIGCLVGFSLFAVKFSTVFYILIGGTVGLLTFLIQIAKDKKKGKPSDKDKGGER